MSSEDEDNKDSKYDFKSFIKNYITSVVFGIGLLVFIIGGIGLYTTKVAQANILPDDVKLAPYTAFDRVVKDIPIDINVMRPSFMTPNKETLSQKAVFNSKEFLDSFSKGIICGLKQNADPRTGFFPNVPLFFSKVYDNIIAKNFYFMNTIFFYLSYLPESLIMLLYGMFGFFIWIALYFWNMAFSIFYHFVNIPQLFRTASETDNSKWESQEAISFLRFGKLLLFFFLWIPLGLISAFIMPFILTVYGLTAPLSATYKIQKTNKINGIIDFIKDTFSYKSNFFFILATLSLISGGLTDLGVNSLIGIGIAIAFAFFMGLYSNEMPENGVNGFTEKIRQNLKQAPVEPINMNSPKLVNICQQIPAIDEIIQGGTYRESSLMNNDNNDFDDEIDAPEVTIPNDMPTETTPVEPTTTNEPTPVETTTTNESTPVEPTPQQGGKKRFSGKSTSTKKYNIRLT
jgi:hypothetical protein